jgi:CheY-like chemotaxis protein
LLFGKQDYNLILMDGNMPHCNGLEAASRIIAIEQAENRPHTPIVALTARVLSGDREKFLAAGMDDYLSKPIQVPELKEILKKYIGSPKKQYPAGQGH